MLATIAFKSFKGLKARFRFRLRWKRRCSMVNPKEVGQELSAEETIATEH